MADTWFHATPDGGRNGPMRADDLLRLFQAGRIHAATPVWREGMADWVPLASVATTLGLPAMPPPLPRAPALPPPRRGLHWIWIVVLVLAGLAVPVLAILAAIALPAYNDYRIRSGIVQVVADSAPLRMAVARSHADAGVCPASGAARSSDTSLPPDASLDGVVAPLLASAHRQRLDRPRRGRALRYPDRARGLRPRRHRFDPAGLVARPGQRRLDLPRHCRCPPSAGRLPPVSPRPPTLRRPYARTERTLPR